ncbi:MAG: 30S ribosomal protein S9 [Candidatus Omnitrophica bacterium CG07_land_8_20_14_0_80_50_8]|nr:MAG: 30S ribosomal protein S9 [Candidatus Omnitrophica bacterium CG07_land_8_20_14_0_80_50_8]
MSPTELLKAPAEKDLGTGRRKEATARVQLFKGTGIIQVNKRDIKKYFGRLTLQMIVRQPLEAMQLNDKLDIIANVRGGGLAGQAGAVRHAISRALVKFDETLKPLLRRGDYLTRDSRMKERKKYGRKGARRRFQFSKR